ncbi:MAG: hypothetical protein ACF8R7_18985 [Phycisphaerales bacterium JB039]
MKRWRRTLLTCALLLLAGAAGNIAVAWVCAGRRAARPLRPAFGCVRHWDNQADGITTMLTIEAGWPMRSLGLTTRRERLPGIPIAPGMLANTPPAVGGPYSDGVRLPRWILERGWFYATAGRGPSDPLLPGFAVNTVCYAALIAALLGAPLMARRLRRRLRARRGRCPTCNYDLAGIDGPCPECGFERMKDEG